RRVVERRVLHAQAAQVGGQLVPRAPVAELVEPGPGRNDPDVVAGGEGLAQPQAVDAAQAVVRLREDVAEKQDSHRGLAPHATASRLDTACCHQSNVCSNPALKSVRARQPSTALALSLAYRRGFHWAALL